MREREQDIERTHIVTSVDQRVDDVRADESGGAGDQDPHAGQTY